MALIESALDLKLIRAEEAKGIADRKMEKQNRLILGMGTAGTASGTKDTLKAIAEFIEIHNLNRTFILSTGDIGLDSFEPILRMEVAGQDRIVYGKVTPEKAVEIMRDHVMNGNVLEKYILNGQMHI